MTKKPKRGRPAGVTTGNASLFAKWRIALGMGAKEVSAAGALIGLPTYSASLRNRGRVESDLMERLAMSAVRAGLPPWSPKTDAEIGAVGQVAGAMRTLAENQTAPPSKTSAGRRRKSE